MEHLVKSIILFTSDFIHHGLNFSFRNLDIKRIVTFCAVRLTAISSEREFGRKPGFIVLNPFEFARKFCFSSLGPINSQIVLRHLMIVFQDSSSFFLSFRFQRSNEMLIVYKCIFFYVATSYFLRNPFFCFRIFFQQGQCCAQCM